MGSTQAQSEDTLGTVFISHGLVGETMRPGTDLYNGLQKYYKEQNLENRIETAIIISAHWEEKQITINTNPYPGVTHDHPSEWLFQYNFKFETDLELANKIYEKLTQNGFDNIKQNNQRDADHGAWGGLFSFYDIQKQQDSYNIQQKQYVPKIVLISLHSKMDAQLHYKLGQILGEFRNNKTILICSGASTHNFDNNRKQGFTEQSKKWEEYLQNIITNQNETKRQELLEFKNNQLYHYMHHSHEHFMPIIVALGSSKQPGKLFCLEQQFTSMCSCYSFQ